jgi:hypothetical protein
MIAAALIHDHCHLFVRTAAARLLRGALYLSSVDASWFITRCIDVSGDFAPNLMSTHPDADSQITVSQCLASRDGHSGCGLMSF